MFVSKYSKILTVILVILIIGIFGTLGYFAYDVLVIKSKNNNAKDVVEEFSKNVKKERVDDDTESDNDSFISINSIEREEVAEKKGEKVYMEGYEVMGTIKIPKINLEYPILAEVTKKSLETSVAILYGVGLNEPGNTTIVGHNYRNGLFFSNNSKLSKGDKIDITDQSGQTITYSIYDMFMTSPNDAEYMVRDTEGAREISLSTCNNDSSQRLVILAREK